MGNRSSRAQNTGQIGRRASLLYGKLSSRRLSATLSWRGKRTKRSDNSIRQKYFKDNCASGNQVRLRNKQSNISTYAKYSSVCKIFNDEPLCVYLILKLLIEWIYFTIFITHYWKKYTHAFRNPETLLDIGAGTGTWLLEMANALPDCHCIGVDITTNVPDNIMLPNCRFEKMNVLNGLDFLDNGFQYVHQRHMLAAIPTDHWRLHLAECYRIAAPNGWLELVETDYIIRNPGIAGDQLNALLTTTGGYLGWAVADFATRMPWLMSSVGFGDVQPITYRLPLGDWAPHPQRSHWSNVERFFTALAPSIYQICGVDDSALARLLHDAKLEADECESYWLIHTVCGRK
ncbi:S-adenosyl-L-methionine-dependent methyltransferase [Syncephalis fuscata]|nr:S-adenosyl-L-methionine-dependent methyltransferase [Syncephalis fuscata]